MNDEIWKPVPGWETRYEVSNHGRVRSCSRTVQYRDGRRYHYRGQIVVPFTHINGHLAIFVQQNRRRQRFSIARLVAQVFIPNPENKREVNHIDGDVTHNHFSNLEWATSSENSLHRARVLKKLLGSENGASKLTEADVRRIKGLIQLGWSNREIAEEFGVVPENIWHIRRGKTWRHVLVEG